MHSALITVVWVCLVSEFMIGVNNLSEHLNQVSCNREHAVPFSKAQACHYVTERPSLKLYFQSRTDYNHRHW